MMVLTLLRQSSPHAVTVCLQMRTLFDFGQQFVPSAEWRIMGTRSSREYPYFILRSPVTLTQRCSAEDSNTITQEVASAPSYLFPIESGM